MGKQELIGVSNIFFTQSSAELSECIIHIQHLSAVSIFIHFGNPGKKKKDRAEMEVNKLKN